MSVAEHKEKAPPPNAVRVGILTISDTRTARTDAGGPLIRERCQRAGFAVVEAAVSILPDEPTQVTAAVQALCAGGTVDAVLITGGTGLSRRDTTVEAVTGLFDKTIDGYGELFRVLSYQEIGAAAMLSRACAGTVGEVVVFTMPGSPKGVRLAMDKLIVPELGHIVGLLSGGARGGGHGKRAHGQEQEQDAHAPGHEHVHSHEHAHEHHHHSHQHEHAHSHEHVHGHEHGQGHSHEHAHGHEHGHEHAHGHEEHAHRHGDQRHRR